MPHCSYSGRCIVIFSGVGATPCPAREFMTIKQCWCLQLLCSFSTVWWILQSRHRRSAVLTICIGTQNWFAKPFWVGRQELPVPGVCSNVSLLFYLPVSDAYKNVWQMNYPRAFQIHATLVVNWSSRLHLVWTLMLFRWPWPPPSSYSMNQYTTVNDLLPLLLPIN